MLFLLFNSTGMSYSAVVNGTDNSTKFICYLKKLPRSIEESEVIESSKIIFILDNTPCHQAKCILNYFKNNQIKYSFLPQYFSELAPVEKFFAQMKQKITDSVKIHTNIWSKNRKKILRKALQSIGTAKIKALWINFYSKVRILTNEART